MTNVAGHENKNWIQYHIWQLKPIFEEYEDIIMCVKTGMLGPWGEQHSSPEAQSVDAYKKALMMNPKDMDTKYNLAYALQKLQQQENQDQDKDKDDENKKDKDKKDQDKNEDQKDQDQKDKKDQEQENKDEQEQFMSLLKRLV